VDRAAVSHLAAAAGYAGFQWTVHGVVYPQFPVAAAADPQRFAEYETNHQRRIAHLVGPLFAALISTTAAVVRTRPRSPLGWVSAAATAAVLASTAFGAVPEHARLASGWDPAAHRRLHRWDGVRTGAATLQLASAVLLLRAATPPGPVSVVAHRGGRRAAGRSPLVRAARGA